MFFFKRNKKNNDEKPSALENLRESNELGDNQELEEENPSKTFTGYALLDEENWDKEKFVRNLKDTWNINSQYSGQGFSDLEDIVFFIIDERKVVISFVPFSIPNNEAEINARNNFMWPQAEEVTKHHKAHLIVSVLSNNKNDLDSAKLLVKCLETSCKQEQVCGIYTCGTVFEPSYYASKALMLKEGKLPIFNLVSINMYKMEETIYCYTLGMESFDMREIELIDNELSSKEVYQIVVGIATHILANNILISNDVTVEGENGDLYCIQLNDGVSLPQKVVTIKKVLNCVCE